MQFSQDIRDQSQPKREKDLSLGAGIEELIRKHAIMCGKMVVQATSLQGVLKQTPSLTAHEIAATLNFADFPTTLNPYEVVFKLLGPTGTISIHVTPDGNISANSKIGAPAIAQKLNRAFGKVKGNRGLDGVYLDLNKEPEKFKGDKLRTLLIDPDRIGPKTSDRRIADEQRKIAREEVFPAMMATLLGLIGVPFSRGAENGDLLVASNVSDQSQSGSKDSLSGISIKAYRADSRIFIEHDPRGQNDFAKTLVFLKGGTPSDVMSANNSIPRRLLLVQNGASDQQLLELKQRFVAQGVRPEQIVILIAPLWRAAGIQIRGNSRARNEQAISLEIDLPKALRFLWLKEIADSGQIVVALHAVNSSISRFGGWNPDQPSWRVTCWPSAMISYCLSQGLFPVLKYLARLY